MQQDKVIMMLRNALTEKGFESLYMAQPKPLTIKEQYEGCEVSNCSLPFVPPPICGRRGMYHPHVRFVWVSVATHKDTPVIAFKQGVPYAVFPCVAYYDDISIATPLKAEDVPNSVIAWLKENGYTINK